ncbi:acylphosphatase [Zobellella sp. DQSA1]|uniref:acylphosphatase n=1 Tax=Zobellella sp. DQSA1 TaxID=3342386 RepID=UPI0035BF0733
MKNTNIKMTASLNTLPVFNGEAQAYDFDESQIFSTMLGINRIILRRSLYERNIKIDIWNDEDGIPQWTAMGINKSVRFRYAMPSYTSNATRKITNNKDETKKYLDAQGVYTPKGIIIDSKDYDKAITWFSQLEHKKVVVKPVAGSGGKGVTSSITSENDVISAMQGLSSKRVVLEEHIDGDDHRILVVGGKFIAAIKRIPAFVIGDGVSSIEQLVDAKNKTRSSNPYTGRYPIKLSSDVLSRLERSGLSPSSIVPAETRVNLQTIANVGAGGDSEDVTGAVHPDFMRIAEDCWRALPELAYCGIDLIADDISKSPIEQRYAVIEINANCDISMHHFPTCGMPIDAAGAIADYLFPADPVAECVAIKIEVKGKVQKVGFRKWMGKQAMMLGIKGLCKNTSLGTVEAFLEGSEYAVSEMIKLCTRGPGESYPAEIIFESAPFIGFKSFSIEK